VRKDRLRWAGIQALTDEERLERHRRRARERSRLISPEEWRRKYYKIKQDPERLARLRARQREWLSNNRGRARSYEAKARAKRQSADAGNVSSDFIIELLSREVCYLCGLYVLEHDRQVEHVIPIARGGKHDVDNLEMACSACNGAKSDKTPFEYADHCRWLLGSGLA